MKKIFIALFAAFSLTSIGYTEEIKTGFELTIQSNKSVYLPGEQIEITAILLNHFDLEVILFWNNTQPLIQDNGANVLIVTIPAAPVLDVDILRIKPKDSFRKTIVLPNSVKAPAKYQVALQYNEPDLNSDFKTNANQQVWRGPLSSNSITIEVKEKE